MRNALSMALCCAALGCSQSTAAPAPTAPSPPPGESGAERAEMSDSLAGLWVEFWALEGQADTQQYALFDDGRFGWRASSADATGGVVRRWGSWSREGDTLVLRVAGEEQGGACQGDACRVRLDPPREERLAVGDCPPNEEAKSLDPSYRCISLAGQAFWRRPQQQDPSAYIP